MALEVNTKDSRHQRAEILRSHRLLLATAMFPLFLFGALNTVPVGSWPTLAPALAGLLFYLSYALYVEKDAHAVVARRLFRIDAEIERRIAASNMEGQGSPFDRFVDGLNQEVSRSKRYGLSLALITITLSANDAAAPSGVQAQVLRTVADKLRTEDFAGYLGGAEYGIVLPHTDRQGAEIVIARLSRELRDLQPSLGLVVTRPTSAVTADRLLARARQDTLARALNDSRQPVWNDVAAVH